MAVDERRRSHAYTRLAAVVGEEAATTMFELLPPAGTDLARTTDVVHVEERIDQRFGSMDERMADGFAVLRGELLAAFRGEIVAAVSGQTRAVIVSVTTTIFGLAALTLAVAQLL